MAERVSGQSFETLMRKQSVTGYIALGDVYKAKKDNKLARQAYEKAAELNPRDFDVKDKLKQITQ
jgi:Tfp pilus assembly protein PilF